jgi:DNA-binding IclR family transcriptional regulator
VFTADSPECPRLPTLKFGYHDAPHATALGKILLAHLDGEKRSLVLPPEPMPRFTKATITGHRELIEQLSTVTHRGVAWEFGEMEAGSTCAAAAVWGAPGWLIGSVAISAESGRLAHRRAEVEAILRATAVRLGRCYRPDNVASTGRSMSAPAPRTPLDATLSMSENGPV